MSFGEKKKVSADPTAKWSVTFMNEMSKSRGTNRTGDTFNKALFSLIKADIKETSSATSDKSIPKTARGLNGSVNSKLGNTVNTPEPSSDGRVDVPGDRRSRGLTRSFSLNEITAMLAQPVPEEEARAPEITTTPTSADTTHPATTAPSTVSSDTCQTETSTTSAVAVSQPSTEISDSGTIQSTPQSDSGTTLTEVIETKNSTVNGTVTPRNSAANSVPNSARDDTCQTETPATSAVADSSASTTEPATPRVKVPPLPVSPRSPRLGHRHTRSVGSQSLIDNAISPRSKNSNDASISPRDSGSPRAKNATSPREIVNTTGAVIGASATDANSSKDKNSSEKNSSKDKKRTLKKRSSKRTRPPSTITSPANNSSTNNSTANNSNSDDTADSPRSIKATPNKARRVSNSVSQIGGYRRGSISSDTLPYSPRARTLKHAPKIDANTIEATSQKLNLDYMDEVLVSIQERLLFPSVKSEFTAEKLSQMPLSWVMQRMPLLRARRDLAFKHHMHAKQLRTGKVTSPSSLKKDYLLSNMTRWSSSDINKIRPGSSQSVSQSQSLTNSPVKAVSNINMRHVRAGSGNQRRVTSIQLIPASPRDSDPNKESKSSPKSGEEVKK